MIKRYLMRIQKWSRYALGSSYQHMQQGHGTQFHVGQVAGYYNDLRHKANWTGAFKAQVPAVRTDTNPSFHFPIVIFQWGLGNWDRWLESGKSDDASMNAVLSAANWAVANLTQEGGWECWTGLVRPTISPYSAMAQGQGISLLVRAAQVENCEIYKDVANRAADFMLDSNPHGLTKQSSQWISLEEYPGDTFPSVLNGWVFALAGLYDLAISTNRSDINANIKVLAAGLAQAAQEYDNGYWSTYDLAGNIASPFYHDLHIAQLRTLAMMFPQNAGSYEKVAAQFDGYRKRRYNRAKSIAVKVVQKLSQPTVGEME